MIESEPSEPARTTLVAKVARFFNEAADMCLSDIGLWGLVVVLIVAAIAGSDDMRQGNLPRGLLGCFCGWVAACHLAAALLLARGGDDEEGT